MDYKEYSAKLEKKDRCQKCRESRSKFEDEEKKFGNEYSPFVGVISNPSPIKSPIDVLIVSKGHGGGHTWKGLNSAEEQAEEMADYYLRNDKKVAKPGNKKEPVYLDKSYQFPSFNCREIYKLLNALNHQEKEWVMTDFIHCYVSDKDNNPDKAAEFCHPYLRQIIKDFEPEKIVLMGGNVQDWYGEYIEDKLENEPKKIETYFPSGLSADYWVTQGGADYILDKIE